MKARASSFLYSLFLLTFPDFLDISSLFNSTRPESDDDLCGPLFSAGDTESFSKMETRSASDDLPDFLVTIHSYELPNLNSPEIIALNLVTDIVFSKRR